MKISKTIIFLIFLFVIFAKLVPPMIWVQNQLVGAFEGQRLSLECHSEAYPKSINYWTREKGDIVPQGKRNRLVCDGYKF
jgi:hypothetical protein